MVLLQCLIAHLCFEGNKVELNLSQEVNLRFGHPSMALVKWLARRSLLGRFSEKIKQVSDADHPMCARRWQNREANHPA